MRDLRLRELARVRVGIEAPLDAGAVPGGTRRVIPIAGGRVEGAVLRGAVLPLGADWNLLRGDGSESVSARYVIRTDDGVLISVCNEGILADRPSGRIGVTTLRMEAPEGSVYGWLNDATIVGRLDVDHEGDEIAVVLGYWVVEPV